VPFCIPAHEKRTVDRKRSKIDISFFINNFPIFFFFFTYGCVYGNQIKGKILIQKKINRNKKMIKQKTCFRSAFILSILFPFFFWSFTAEAAKESKFPRSVGAVNDFASVVSPKVKAAMESLSREILQKTGASVVVVTVKSLEGSVIDLYATELFEYWGNRGRRGQGQGCAYSSGT